MLPLSTLPIGIIVLALAACGMATTSGPTVGSSRGGQGDLTCALILTETNGQLQIEGQVQSVQPVSGRYAMTIAQTGRAGQNLIDQSGDFQTWPGETVTLSMATLSGSRTNYDASLTVEYGSVTRHCPVTSIAN